MRLVNRNSRNTLLKNLNEFKFPRPDELHSRVVKELAEEHSESLPFLKKTWKMGEVLDHERIAKVVSIFKNSKKGGS